MIQDNYSSVEMESRAKRQSSVLLWASETFGNGIEISPGVRLMRLVEEVCELAQAEGLSLNDVQRVASSVFDRPTGETYQELGGVMITTMAFAEARGLSVATAERDELRRVNTKSREHFQKRVAEKHEAGLVPEVTSASNK